jgi:glucose/arabinose dehydrogenase
MYPQIARRRRVITFSSIAVTALAILFLLRVSGWRAGFLARLHTNNAPVVVSPPARFQPRVPSGFRVSVFAKGFTEPRWLAVAPDGDVFVADSAPGEVLVLHEPKGQGGSPSRETFANHLNLPFRIAFHDDYVYIADTNEVLRFRYDPKRRGGWVMRNTSLTCPGWAITSIGPGRWPLAQMAGCYSSR